MEKVKIFVSCVDFCKRKFIILSLMSFDGGGDVTTSLDGGSGSSFVCPTLFN